MSSKLTRSRLAISALTAARLIRRHTGKPVLVQLAEMARLARLPNRITPDEYVALRLFDDDRLGWSDKLEFLGQRAKPYVYRINDASWRAVADDKLVCLAQLEALSLPIAPIIAIHPARRIYPGARRLSTLSDVARFLRCEAPYPLFSKPIGGTLGRQAYGLTAYDPTADQLLLKNGRRLDVEWFLENAIANAPGGVLFQDLLQPHPALSAVCGDRLATVRVLVLHSPEGPVFHRATCRLPVGANMVDNFKHGTLGNLLASLNPLDGSIRRVVAGAGMTMREVDRHPDTERRFDELQLPQWERVLELCGVAAQAMAGLAIQGWDVALTDRGPLLMEVNFQGDLDIYQFADGRGIADDRWRQFLAVRRNGS